MISVRLLRVWVCIAVFSGPLALELRAQADHFNSELLPAVRRAASVIPGDAPTAVNFVLLNPFKATLGYTIERGGTDSVAHSLGARSGNSQKILVDNPARLYGF